MNDKKSLTLILLVGGKSRRMGRDKSLLKMSCLDTSQSSTIKKDDGIFGVQDKTFFENALCVLFDLAKQNASLDIHIAVSCREEQKELMERRLQDFYVNNAIQEIWINIFLDKGLGVVEALSTCLLESKTDSLFIPCDVPYLNSLILQRLVLAWQSSDKLLYLFQDESLNKKKQSLIALYTQNTIPFLEEALQNNAPLQHAIPQNLIYSLLYTQEESLFFHNCNTIEDLKN